MVLYIFRIFFQNAGFSSDGILFVVTDATLVIFGLSFLNIFFGKRTIINTTHVFDVKKLVVLSTLSLTVMLIYIFKKMPYQITDLLVNRQAYFSENPLVLICLHALPIIGISNVVALLETKNLLLRSIALISLLIVIFSFCPIGKSNSNCSWYGPTNSFLQDYSNSKCKTYI